MQFRELADHIGQQIGFGQPRSAFGGSRIGADGARDDAGQGLHTGAAFQLAAEFVVVNNPRQFGHARIQAHLLVGLEEKARV